MDGVIYTQSFRAIIVNLSQIRYFDMYFNKIDKSNRKLQLSQLKFKFYAFNFFLPTLKRIQSNLPFFIKFL